MSGIWAGLADLLLQVSFGMRFVIGAIIFGLLGGFSLAFVPQWYKAEGRQPPSATMLGLKGNFKGLKVESNTLSGPGTLLQADGNFEDASIKKNKQDNQR